VMLFLAYDVTAADQSTGSEFQKNESANWTK